MKMTTQQAFDRNWQVFVVEKSGRCADGTQCLYWKDGHPGCAVGCLIDWDQVPEDKLEKTKTFLGDVDKFFHNCPWIATQFEDVPLEFLRELQNIHDAVTNYVVGGIVKSTRAHEDSLRRLAGKYDLQVPA